MTDPTPERDTVVRPATRWGVRAAGTDAVRVHINGLRFDFDPRGAADLAETIRVILGIEVPAGHASTLAGSHGGEHGDLTAIIRRAIADPGAVLPRVEGETVSNWSARAVLAVLSEDTGDLRERLVAALENIRTGDDAYQVRMPSRRHRELVADALLPVFSGETVRAAIRITGLEEANAELLERLERQTEQVDDLAEETAARTGEVEQLASRYEAQVAALRQDAEIAEEKFGEMNAAAIRREKQVAALREELAGVGGQGERDLEEATRQRERAEQAEAQVAALQQELDLLKIAAKTVAENDWYGRLARSEAEIAELNEERRATVNAIYNNRMAHIRKWHPNYAFMAVCSGCQALVAISRDTPSRPDDPEEIRRLAESTETEGQ